MSGLLRQRHQVALRPRRLLRHFQARVSLLEVGARPLQDAPRRDGRQVAFLQTMIGVDEVLDAVGFGEEISPAESVDVKFDGRRLVTANEMAWQADPRYRIGFPVRLSTTRLR